MSGRSPTAEVLALANQPGITVTGTVDDLRPFYREALAAVVPLRVGGGTRLKILEAMAAGVPVISTSLGAEGLAAEDGKEIVLADTPSAMAEAVASLDEASPEWHRLSENGTRLVLSRYDWTVIGKEARARLCGQPGSESRRLERRRPGVMSRRWLGN